MSLDRLKNEKMPWSERSALIKAMFPAVDTLDWKRVFSEDLELMGWVLNDILKKDQATQGRPGPRPPLDPSRAGKRLAQYRGEDYSLAPFSVTLVDLKGDLSIRKLAALVDLDVNRIYRLLNGAEPDIYSMQMIAKAFDKDPSFFLEYRIAFILDGLYGRMIDFPDASVTAFKKLKEFQHGNS